MRIHFAAISAVSRSAMDSANRECCHFLPTGSLEERLQVNTNTPRKF
jgi:hypothetical protein